VLQRYRLPRRLLGRLGRSAVAASCCLLAACTDTGVAPVALVGATVIDGTGAPPLADAVVVVSEGSIIDVGPRASVQIPRNATQLDLSGRYLIPGLIDLNVELERWALERYVVYGVTAVRDRATETDSAAAVAEALGLGSLLGPRLYFAGGAIGQDISSAAEARRAVDAKAVTSADFVAVDPSMSPAVLRAAVDESKSFMLPVSAELGLTDAVTAAEAGIASLELLSGIPQAALGIPGALQQDYRAGYWQGWIASAKSWSRLRPSSLDRIASQLAGTGVNLVPSLVLYHTYGNLDDPAVADLGRGTVPAGVLDRWREVALESSAALTGEDLRTIRQGRPAQDRFVDRFLIGGGTVLVGTGSGRPMMVPGASLHRELLLLVGAGMAPVDAIAAATGRSAELLRADSIGVIAAGRVADMVILSADPLDDINNSLAIDQVMVRGLLLDPDSLSSRW